MSSTNPKTPSQKQVVMFQTSATFDWTNATHGLDKVLTTEHSLNSPPYLEFTFYL